jgi:hypothetical protein
VVLDVADGEHGAVRSGQSQQLVGLDEARSDRILYQHVAARLEQQSRSRAVVDGGCGHDHGVGLAGGAQIGQRGHAVLGCDRLQAVGIGVVRPQETNPGHPAEDADVVPSEMTCPDNRCGEGRFAHGARA